MLADMPAGLAILVLLEDDADSLTLTHLLAAERDASSSISAVFLRPPVRGLGFFADAARQPELDAWWSVEVPRDARPVYLAMDEEGLDEWLDEVDGDAFVGVTEPGRLEVYASRHSPSVPRTRGRITAFPCTGPLDLAAITMHELSRARGEDRAVFDPAEALRMAALSPRFPFRPEVAAADPGLTGLSTPSPALAPGRSGPAALQLPASAPTPASALPRRPRAPAAGRITELFRRRRFQPRSDDEVARQLAERGPTVVVTGSRKGGVGKTSFAAGIAIVAGTVLDQIGHRACIVDANIANPDAWGELHLPAEAATVRDTVAAVLANREPPPPIYAATPALACYPEVREATEYSRVAIRHLADHLRHRYTLIVVDMSNRLPDPTAGPEAAVAAYWLEVADVLVLPTTSARADFNGALDYLEVAGLPPTLVPYIVSGERRLRDNPTTVEYLAAIRRRAHRIVEIPDEANAVRLAAMEGVPAQQLSPRLGLAYRELTEAIAGMPRRLGL